MFFHASPTPGIQLLQPRVSNHGKALVYLSDRRENVLVYLSNAVEKFWREQGFPPRRSYQKWASYGFTKEGILCLEEYYPGATEETYLGVSGYVYTCAGGPFLNPQPDIPHAFLSESPVPVLGCEFVPDALAALKAAEKEGRAVLRSYSENSEKKLRWIRQAVEKDYNDPGAPPDYRAFLEAKFPFLREEKGE